MPPKMPAGPQDPRSLSDEYKKALEEGRVEDAELIPSDSTEGPAVAPASETTGPAEAGPGELAGTVRENGGSAFFDRKQGLEPFDERVTKLTDTSHLENAEQLDIGQFDLGDEVSIRLASGDMESGWHISAIKDDRVELIRGNSVTSRTFGELISKSRDTARDKAVIPDLPPLPKDDPRETADHSSDSTGDQNIGVGQRISLEEMDGRVKQEQLAAVENMMFDNVQVMTERGLEGGWGIANIDKEKGLVYLERGDEAVTRSFDSFLSKKLDKTRRTLEEVPIIEKTGPDAEQLSRQDHTVDPTVDRLTTGAQLFDLDKGRREPYIGQEEDARVAAIRSRMTELNDQLLSAKTPQERASIIEEQEKLDKERQALLRGETEPTSRPELRQAIDAAYSDDAAKKAAAAGWAALSKELTGRTGQTLAKGASAVKQVFKKKPGDFSWPKSEEPAKEGFLERLASKSTKQIEENERKTFPWPKSSASVEPQSMDELKARGIVRSGRTPEKKGLGKKALAAAEAIFEKAQGRGAKAIEKREKRAEKARLAAEEKVAGKETEFVGPPAPKTKGLRERMREEREAFDKNFVGPKRPAEGIGAKTKKALESVSAGTRKIFEKLKLGKDLKLMTPEKAERAGRTLGYLTGRTLELGKKGGKESIKTVRLIGEWYGGKDPKTKLALGLSMAALAGVATAGTSIYLQTGAGAAALALRALSGSAIFAGTERYLHEKTAKKLGKEPKELTKLQKARLTTEALVFAALVGGAATLAAQNIMSGAFTDALAKTWEQGKEGAKNIFKLWSPDTVTPGTPLESINVPYTVPGDADINKSFQPETAQRAGAPAAPQPAQPPAAEDALAPRPETPTPAQPQTGTPAPSEPARPPAPGAPAHVEATGEYGVQKGDNMYKILRANIPELGALEGAQQTNAIENILAEIKKDPAAFGITSGDVNKLAVGDNINLEKIGEILSNKTIGGENIIEHAKNLSAETVKNIESYTPTGAAEATASPGLEELSDPNAFPSNSRYVIDNEGNKIWLHEKPEGDAIPETGAQGGPANSDSQGTDNSNAGKEGQPAENVIRTFIKENYGGSTSLGGKDLMNLEKFVQYSENPAVLNVQAGERTLFETAYERYKNDIDDLFGKRIFNRTPGLQSEKWIYLKENLVGNLSAIPNPDLDTKKVLDYVETLARQSGERPGYDEKTSVFIKRAIFALTKHNKFIST